MIGTQHYAVEIVLNNGLQKKKKKEGKFNLTTTTKNFIDPIILMSFGDSINYLCPLEARKYVRLFVESTVTHIKLWVKTRREAITNDYFGVHDDFGGHWQAIDMFTQEKY